MSRRNYGRVKSRIAQGHQVESKKSKEKKWKRKSLIKMKMRDEEMKSDGASQGSSYKVEPNVKEAVRQFLHALERPMRRCLRRSAFPRKRKIWCELRALSACF